MNKLRHVSFCIFFLHAMTCSSINLHFIFTAMKKSLLRVFLLASGILAFNAACSQPFSFEKIYSHSVLSFDGIARVSGMQASDESLISGTTETGTFNDGESVAMLMDSNGTVLHSLAMGKPMFHDVTIEAMHKNQEYYFTGYTRSTDTSASPLFTSFLVRTDSELNVIWQRNFIFPGNDFFVKAASTCANGNFLFTGNNYDFASGNWYSFVMKTTQNGTVTLCKMSDVSMPLDPAFITELSNHDLLLTGSVTLGFEQVMPTAIRFDSLGNVLWAKIFDYDLGSVQQSSFIFAKELVSGNILLAGQCDYQAMGNHGLMDYQVFKIDSSGNVLWMKTYGGSVIDWMYGADYDDQSDQLTMLGTSQSFTGNGGFFGYAVSIDTTGAVLSSVLQGDTNISGSQIILYNQHRLPSGNSIMSGVDASGTAGFYAAKTNGGISGPASCHTMDVPVAPLSAVYPELIYPVPPFPFDVNIIVNAVPFDYYSGVTDSLVCFNNPVGVENIYSHTLKLFPNPASENLQITLPETRDENSRLTFFNLLGKKILDIPVPRSGKEMISIDITGLAPGIYIVQAGAENKLLVKR